MRRRRYANHLREDRDSAFERIEDDDLDPRSVDRSTDPRDYVPPRASLGWARRRDVADRQDQAAAPHGTGRYDRSGQEHYDNALHQFVERRHIGSQPRRFDRLTGRWELDGGGVQLGGAPSRSFFGRGPRNYRRPDERIREDVCDLLTEAGDVDASDIEVEVAETVVLLSGSVDSRATRRRAEDLAASVPGVTDVQNRLRAAASDRAQSGTLA